MKNRSAENKEFIKNSGILILGTLFAQLLPLGLMTILRRIYDPSVFTTFALYFPIVSVLALVASFQYHQTIVLPKEDKDAKAIVKGALVIAAIFSSLIGLFMLLFRGWIVAYFDWPLEMYDWLMVVPISTFLLSAHLIFTGWLTRKKAFKAQAINKIARRSGEGTAQLTSYYAWSGNGILLGNVIGDALNFLVYWIQFKMTGGNLAGIKLNEIKTQLKKYKDFPIFGMLPNLANTIGMFLPTFMIYNYYEDSLQDVTGQFDLSRMVLAMPIALISMSIGQVLLQRLSSQRNNKQPTLGFFKKVAFLLAGGAIIGAVICMFFGEEIFALIMGEDSRTAGMLSEILVIGFAIKFAISPLSVSFIAFEKIRLNSIWQLVYFFSILGLFFFVDLSLSQFLWAYVCLDLIMYTAYGILAYFIVNQYEKSIS